MKSCSQEDISYSLVQTLLLTDVLFSHNAQRNRQTVDIIMPIAVPSIYKTQQLSECQQGAEVGEIMPNLTNKKVRPPRYDDIRRLDVNPLREEAEFGGRRVLS